MKRTSKLGEMRLRVLLLAVCSVLGGCRSQKSLIAPSIEFTKVPPATQGGPEKVDTIAGRVHGSRPGEQIVIYAHSGPWWVQPYAEHPFVPIQSDSNWSTATHFGFEYAALLVDPRYHPPPTLDVAPTPGGLVVSVAIVKGTGPPTYAPTKPIKFSGYDWAVRTVGSNRGDTYNLYDPNNVWTDGTGALHLRITTKDNVAYCAQLGLTRSLGYGTYAVTVRDISHLDPAEVLSMYTFDEWHGDQYYREMDVELTRWGDPRNQNNAQYGVQPFYVPGNVYQFKAPAGPLTYAMRWRSGSVTFTTVRGARNGSDSPPVSEHEFTSGVPTPGQEAVKLEFYAIPSDKYPLKEVGEVVIEKFEYLP
jgi:hypothetical protein